MVSEFGSYRARGLAAQQRAADAPTDGLKTLWLELAQRYFELADEYDVGSFLRFSAKLRPPSRKTTI
jgi:hypothetical protein